LILLDIGLPTLNGIEAARQIRDLAPKSQIIFLTQESSADLAKEALGLGVRGYVVKTKAGSELFTAVVAVLLGETFVSGTQPEFHCAAGSAIDCEGHSLPPCCPVDCSLFRAPLASNANSSSGTLNREEPQSKQTKTFRNSQTPGLSRFLSPMKWSIISAEKLPCFSEAHAGQDINSPPVSLLTPINGDKNTNRDYCKHSTNT
jgi:Response regulator containing a CheY-like receiver domain and an HTH DNA-binding domain